MRPSSLLMLTLLAAWPAAQAVAADAPAGKDRSALLREENDALRADNRDARSRITDLEAQRRDANKLIALKTARLRALEKDKGKH